MAGYDPMQKRYDLLRARATGQAEEQNAQEQDALKRRFAAMGGLNSGAALKQSTLASERGAARAQSAREGVDVQQMAEEAQNAQAQKQRDWQSGEAKTQRSWQTGERKAGEKFTAGQNAAQQEYDWKKFGVQNAMFDAEMEQKERFKGGDDAYRAQAFAEQVGQFAKQYELSMKQFGLDEEAMRFNMDMAAKMSQENGWMDRLGGMGTRGWKWLFGGGEGTSAGDKIGGILG